MVAGTMLAATSPAPALAQPSPERRAIVSPRAACLEAVRAAERAHGIPEGLLVAIALNESGLHAYALNIGGRSYFPASAEEARRLYRSALLGRRQVMAGCVQVNAGVHARGGDWPLDPALAADWAARYLRSHYERTGDWTRALMRWHGGSPQSSARVVCQVRGKMEVTAPGRSVLDGSRCDGGTAVARLRRDGRALLELAEAAGEP
ncbi:transglycosylase SLT domain-containing protein [Caldovatus sp. SYSU G05006]|uniref:Transglycosylase SLT domain-containing protein n=2 Tax=Caldovatus aquaticus TaxID=2865671 RepID=A0ABS7EXE4_9PROT|nr:transglycosylase SLT domain-containing protein [Caldovatus aquaticus]